MIKVMIIGHLGRDPEMRYLPDGTAVTNFSVASTRKWKSAAGVPGEETTWVRISCFGRLAETTNEYLKKGRQVYVEGRLRVDEKGNPRAYQRRDGTWAASYEMTAESVQFLGGRGEDSGAAPVEPSAEIPDGDTDAEDKIPF